MKQLSLLKSEPTEYGGQLRTKCRHARPLPRKASLFTTIKSSRATGAWAFNHRRNRPVVERLVARFAVRFGITVHSIGNAGNHVHLHLHLPGRALFRAFLRALTAALVFAITGHNRWNKVLTKPFFDHRPHTRIVAEGISPFQAVQDYNRINHLEGHRVPRHHAEFVVRAWRGSLRRKPAFINKKYRIKVEAFPFAP